MWTLVATLVSCDVVQFTIDDIREHISSTPGGRWWVKFSTSTECQFCDEMDSVWEDADKKATFENQPLHFGNVDCERESTLCDINEIEHYPSMLLVDSNTNIVKWYEEEELPDVDDLEKFASTFELPDTATVDMDGDFDINALGGDLADLLFQLAAEEEAEEEVSNKPIKEADERMRLPDEDLYGAPLDDDDGTLSAFFVRYWDRWRERSFELMLAVLDFGPGSSRVANLYLLGLPLIALSYFFVLFFINGAGGPNAGQVSESTEADKKRS